MGRRSKLTLHRVEQMVEEAQAETIEEPKRAAAFEGDDFPEPILVNITGLDVEGLSRLATREFGVQLDADISHDDAMEQVRHLITGRNKFGLR